MAIEYSAINLNSVKGFVRTIDEDFTLYVSPQGDDDRNSGLSVDSPWKTVHKALSYLSDIYITENAIVTISCAAGVYTIEKQIVVNHACGNRIAIVGAPPLEMTLESVDDYVDTTGYTGDTVEFGSATEGGLVTGFVGVRRTSNRLGTIVEDILYTDGVAGGQAYGERFAMVCTVAGSTGALGVDDYVLVRGFSGAYESDFNIDADTAFGRPGSGQYPALTMTDTSVANAGKNETWNRPSQSRPINRLHNLRYPRFAEPENWLQRFFAIGCHKVIGVGSNVPGLDGATGNTFGRITLENKNTNRNPYDKAVNSAGRNTAGQGVYYEDTPVAGLYDYDRPTPCSQNSSEVTESGAGNGNEYSYLHNAPSSTQQHDKIGYMPEPPDNTIRPAVGWEDEDSGGSGFTPTTRARERRTHGKFTVTGLRTVFLFDPNIEVSPVQTGSLREESTGGFGMQISKNSGLHRLDNIVFRPTHDSKIANGEDYGYKNPKTNNRVSLGGLVVWENSTIYNLGPNIAFTDFTNESLHIAGGTVKSMGTCFSTSNGAWRLDTGGKLLLNNTTVTNCKVNLATSNSSLAINRSIILGNNRLQNENSETMMNDSAMLYGEQYNTSESSGTAVEMTSGSVRFKRNLFHRLGTIYNSGADFVSKYNTYQESWMQTLYNRRNGKLDSEFDAIIKPGGLAIHTHDQGHSYIKDILISGSGIQNNDAGDGIANSHGMTHLQGAIILYNTFNHYPLVNYYGGIVDADSATAWVWKVYKSNGQEGQDSAAGSYIRNANAILMHGPTVQLNSNLFGDNQANYGNEGTAITVYGPTILSWSGGEPYEADSGIDP